MTPVVIAGKPKNLILMAIQIWVLIPLQIHIESFHNKFYFHFSSH